MDGSEAREVLDVLRQELSRLGISLPSLRVEPVCTGAEIVHLGGVHPDVARRLANALRSVSEG